MLNSWHGCKNNKAYRSPETLENRICLHTRMIHSREQILPTYGHLVLKWKRSRMLHSCPNLSDNSILNSWEEPKINTGVQKTPKLEIQQCRIFTWLFIDDWSTYNKRNAYFFKLAYRFHYGDFWTDNIRIWPFSRPGIFSTPKLVSHPHLLCHGAHNPKQTLYIENWGVGTKMHKYYMKQFNINCAYWNYWRHAHIQRSCFVQLTWSQTPTVGDYLSQINPWHATVWAKSWLAETVIKSNSCFRYSNKSKVRGSEI